MKRGVASFLTAIAAIFIVSGCASRPDVGSKPLAFSCSGSEEIGLDRIRERLPSWADGSAKKDIARYLFEATCRGSGKFIELEERVAAFDLDGTLVLERPHYLEVLVAVERLKDLAEDDPSLRDEQPYKAALENDTEYINANGAEIVKRAAEGETIKTFHERVVGYLGTQRHPRLGKVYSELFYQPMVELIDLLRELSFEVLIVSGSQQEYIRAFSEDCLKVDEAEVIGSMMKFQLSDSGSFERQGEEWNPASDGEGKVYRIKERTGTLPVLAFGNSGGDEAMLDIASSNPKGKSFIMNHDDPEDEYEYSDDELLETARAKNWTIVSMKNDFRTVFVGSNCLAGQ
ncbi:MAG: HAD family hydrolase [Acidobacteriota bacterium]